MRISLIIFVVNLFAISLAGKISKLPRKPRSIELSVAQKLATETRLETEIVPLSYDLLLHPNLESSLFNGTVKIRLSWKKESKSIELHAHNELDIDETNIQFELENKSSQPKIRRCDRAPKQTIFSIYFEDYLPAGSIGVLKLNFSGHIWENVEGLFKGNYIENNATIPFLATQNRPAFARRIFPCFDEPQYKTPFRFNIVRPLNYTVLFNTKLNRSIPCPVNPTLHQIDEFEVTQPISTFTFGFVLSQLKEVENVDLELPEKVNVKIWGRSDFKLENSNVLKRVTAIIQHLRKYLNAELSLNKLDIVALPGLSAVKPIDNLGLIVFKESDLSNKGYFLVAQELVYQWIGSWLTPQWWTEAHVNKAIAGFLAASTSIELDQGKEFDGKWPMTVLYSIYYEFSKRYPHSRITAMKQETTCSKTELVLRMLNYTLGPETFKKALQQLLTKRNEINSFRSEDLWNILTEQAHLAKSLPENLKVNDIISSWITKDRLPVVYVQRHYENNSATASQRVYLRERPHDVPEQDKMLWFIPLIVLKQNTLDFTNLKSVTWMKKTRDVLLGDLPGADELIIVNPEEIGPFPVNYDQRNWNLLADFLQKPEGRAKVPSYTRAKLLHDAWNLAYAGDLSFATAFNMTLFLKYERDHLVWNPVFTFIDHIGRHIDSSQKVHKKFETYVRILLTPLYEELGPKDVENEESWKSNLRSLSKTFLCRAGYRPCIEEAQSVFKKWMDSSSPDEGNPVPNQFICPVFKWGTQEEWDFGLQRIINFPAQRKQNERTYLLKTLSGCPIKPHKIEKLLNITILEQNEHFTENDIILIFSMLSGGSNGYTTLLQFLEKNWAAIKIRFENKTNLWDSLISSSTGVFTTQEGYDMVSKLHNSHKGEFGSAEHIIEKSLKNIKEETTWSTENLPIIEAWLDAYLKDANVNDQKFIE